MNRPPIDGWSGEFWVKLSGVKPDPPGRAQTPKCGSGFMPEIPTSSKRHDDKQGVAGLHRRLIPPQHDRAAGLCVDRGRRTSIVRLNTSEFCGGFDRVPQFDQRFEGSRVRRRMMRLQMRLFGFDRLMEGLVGQSRFRPGDTTEFDQQILQTAVQRCEILGQYAARAATLRVDGGDLTGERGTQGASWKEWSGPAPERIKAGRHRALSRIAFGPTADDVTDPGMKLEGKTAAVQVHVVGRMGENLGVEEMSQLTCRAAIPRAGKGPGEIFSVDRMETLPRAKGGFVEHRNENHRAAQVGRVPGIDPLTEQGRPFVFIAVRRAIDEQHGAGCAAPDPSIESESRVAETVAMLSGGQRRPIQGRRTRRNVCHD